MTIKPAHAYNHLRVTYIPLFTLKVQPIICRSPRNFS